jgi:hypothetical protein
MTAADMLGLASSPPRPFKSFNISSSPTLPSPRDFSKKNPFGLQTESGLGPISQSFTASCAPGLDLGQQGLLDHTPSARISDSVELGAEVDGSIGNMNSEPTIIRSKTDAVLVNDHLAGIRKKKATKCRDNSLDTTEAKKPRAKKVDGEPMDLATGRKRQVTKRRPKNGDKPGENRPNDKAIRKQRAEKIDGEAQTKMPNSWITKSSVVSRADKGRGSARPKKSELVSCYFSAAEEVTQQSGSPLCNGLLAAVKRRATWTPPKPTTRTATVTAQASVDAECDFVPSDESPILKERSSGFEDLLGNFGFDNIQIPLSGRKVSEISCARKRKLLEMVNTNVSASKSVTAAPETKATKKKARTITDQATSAYSHDEELVTNPAPLLQYFSYQKIDSATSDGFKIPSKPRSKSPAKSSLNRGNGTAQAPVLLSPGSALKQVGRQDFVFGTSSQLAREQSPTFLRDIHTAMQASNELDMQDPFAESIRKPTILPSAGVGRVAPSTKRNLWSAAARGIGGELLDIQMVSPARSLGNAHQVHTTCVDTAPNVSAIPAEDGVWHDIDECVLDVASPGIHIEAICPTEASPWLEQPIFSSHDVKSRGLSPRALGMPQPSETIPQITALSSVTDNPSTAEGDGQKPDYSSFTSAELAKEIASYRFKPVKNRNQMIALLERCWEGKRRMALGSLEANALSSTSSRPLEKPPSTQPESASPKRPYGRPRTNSAGASTKAKSKAKTTKSKALSTIGDPEPGSDATLSKKPILKRTQRRIKQPIDDISDSDAPLTPSPPRRRPSQIGTPPLPLQISTSSIIEGSPDLTPTASHIRLFQHITRAVTSALPSKDPSNPSWHERILLYDPIILEDFTAWLNTGALEKAGWDGEVHPGEVKRWCVSKSICCLWKENLRGGVRTRY